MLSLALLQLIVQGFIGRDIKDAQVPSMIEKLEAWYASVVDCCPLCLLRVMEFAEPPVRVASEVVPDTCVKESMHLWYTTYDSGQASLASDNADLL